MTPEQLKKAKKLSETIEILERMISHFRTNNIIKINSRNWSDVHLTDEESEIITRIFLARRIDLLVKYKRELKML